MLDVYIRKQRCDPINSVRKNLLLLDGFPISICHIKHCKRSSFKGIISIGYCAAEDKKYVGFKGHLLISTQGLTKGFSLAPAHIDERDILTDLQKELKNQGLNLHVPLRKNMQDTRPKALISRIMNVTCNVETVIGQLVERFRQKAFGISLQG